MFAKHLLQAVSFKKPQPVFTPSTVGDYIDTATGLRFRLALEGDRLRVFRSTGPTYISQTTADAAGRIGLVPSSGPIQVWQAGNTGPQSLLSTAAALGAGTHYIAGSTGAYLTTISGGRRVTPFQVGGGVGAAMDTSNNVQIFLARDALYVVPDATASSVTPTPRTLLPASGGRAARCRIDRMIEPEAPVPLLYRVTDAATFEPMFISPYRRPLTTDMRARVYGWQFTDPNGFAGGGTNGKWTVRGGICYRPATVRTTEIDVMPSTAIVEHATGRCSRHEISIHQYTNNGVLRFDGGEVSFTYFGDGLQSGTLTCLQYLDAGDVPSGEFIIESFGYWNSLLQGLASSSSGTPTTGMVGMDAFVRTGTTNQSLLFYDLDAAFIRESAPGPGISMSTGNSFLLQHANLIGFLKTGGGVANRYHVTLDSGETWSELSIGGGTAPAGHVVHVNDQGFLPFTATTWNPGQASSWQPLFIT